MKISKILPKNRNLINVIIETPRGSSHKFDFNEEIKIFELKKTLPMGVVFPFDFDFIPNTKGCKFFASGKDQRIIPDSALAAISAV